MDRPVGKKFHVAFVSTMHPDRGNLAEYGSYLMHAVAKHPTVRHVDVLANVVPGAPKVEKLTSNITIHRVWKLGDARSIMGLLNVVRRLRPDVVHLNAGIRTWGSGRVACFAGASLSTLMRSCCPRVMTTLHTIGDTVRLDQMGSEIGWMTRAGITAATRLYLGSHVVTVTMRSMQRALNQRFGATNVLYVPHGSYGARSEDASVAGPTMFAFGFWGAFKDAGILVRALDGVRAHGIDARLVLGGGPHPYLPQIYDELVHRYSAHKHVRFTGYIEEEDLHRHFRQAAAIVMPYRTNAGASGVLNLTRSYGRPVVISNEEGLLEQLRYEGGAGLVYDSEEGLVKALCEILPNKDLQRSMGEANLAVARHMSIENLAGRMVTYYDNIQVPAPPAPNRPSLTASLNLEKDSYKRVEWPVGGEIDAPELKIA